jgi:hypothetical protein
MKNKIMQSIKGSMITLLLVTSTTAGTLNSTGTAGGAQLLIPQGNMNIALSTGNGSTVDGIGSIFVNPAGVANMTAMSGMASSGDYIADTKLASFAFGMPLNESTNLAIGMKTLDFGDIMTTTAQATEGDGTTFSPSFYVASLSVGNSVSDRVKVGVTGKLISETMGDASATATALDAGVQYLFPNKKLSVGVALKNVGSRLQFEGTGLEGQYQPDGTQPGTKNENLSITGMDSPLPTSLDISVGYQLNNRLSVMSSFENFSYQLNTLTVSGMYRAGNVWLAAGTKMNVQTGDKPTAMSEFVWEDYTKSNWGVSLGFGVDIDLGATMMSVSYANRQSVDFFDDYSAVEVSFSF